MQAAKVIVMAFSLSAGACLISVGCGAVRQPDELPLAAAPFDAAEAGKLQEHTARYLGMPVEKKVDLGQKVQMVFVLIPAGEFEMGTPESEKDREINEGPVHKVKISRPFYMSKFEVTQAQYEAATREKPSYFLGANLPVDEVTWDDAAFFCAKLSDKSGENFRLPTEAEWEYACRAGTTTSFYYGDDLDYSQLEEYGWYGSEKADRQSHPIGQKKPNPFGLYDMHGNLWEWCHDWYDRNYYAISPGADPQGPPDGQRRTLRGGSWISLPRFCRCGQRNDKWPVNKVNLLGFRVVLDLSD